MFLLQPFPSWSLPGDSVAQVADDTASADKQVDIANDELAGKEMELARYYQERSAFTGAINRLKVVIIHYPTTFHVEEALLRLTEIYMVLGIVGEAQTAAAVLGRKFPDAQRYSNARDLLKSSGVEPSEDTRSWISRALN
ncbi:MAG: outer membrane protein assembly factor BamD [Xanthobacteraceae bacterium]